MEKLSNLPTAVHLREKAIVALIGERAKIVIEDILTKTKMSKTEFAQTQTRRYPKSQNTFVTAIFEGKINYGQYLAMLLISEWVFLGQEGIWRVNPDFMIGLNDDTMYIKIN